MIYGSRCSLVLLATITTLAAGCGTTVPPAMSPAMTPAASPTTDVATVVFARPRSGCDTSDYTVVTDDRGHFVANIAPGTQAAVTRAPGPHVFYAWSSRDVRYDKEPGFNPVAATRLQAQAGQTRTVLFRVIMRDMLSNRCYPYAPVAMHHVAPTDTATAQEIAGLDRLDADSIAGQAELDRDPERLKVLLAFGAQRLRRDDEARERSKEDKGATPAPEK